MFTPDSVSVPVPCFVRLPLLPEMLPAKVASELPAVVSVFVGDPVVLKVMVELVPSPDVAIDATVSS